MQDKAKDGTLRAVPSNGDATAAAAAAGPRPTPRKRGRWDVTSEDAPKVKKTATEDGAASAVSRGRWREGWWRGRGGGALLADCC